MAIEDTNTSKRGGKEMCEKGDEMYKKKKGVSDEVIREIIFSEFNLCMHQKVMTM
jgi:hypothetical protein